MRLRSLEIQGFKTFPDKTRLDFTDGITAVVGPNGSGKSNISDAIRWVLGEQSAKALRCSRMEDVVFNGTQQRKKTGYAQVTLSIDNSDRSLEFDGDEVAVTRRFYRSGNSEYLINNTAVRLQDIHELFMDTGLGRDGYSMIGQGKIDSIVSTKGEDRREIFEEAAGISRFRYKKADAERRLEKTEENLVRLRDIMTELEGRVEPLRQQSEKAKAYLSYAEEKRGLEIALWLRTLDKSSLQVREQEDKLAVAQAQYQDIEKSLESIRQEGDDIYGRQNAFAAEIDTIRRDISSFDEQLSAKKAQLSVMQNDILHNEHSAERIRGDILRLKESGSGLKTEIEKRQKEIEGYEASLLVSRKELEALEKSLGELKTDESRSGERLEEISSELSELTKKASEARVGYMTASASIDELSSRNEVLENNVRARRSQLDTLGNIIFDYEAMLSDCVGRMAGLQASLPGRMDRIRELQKACDGVKAEADRLHLDSEQLFRKAKMLEELERSLEGFTGSVKLVMKEAQKGNLSGIHGPVSRVIKTRKEYNTAIEIALGAAMQNIVTATDADAKAAIRFLKQRDGGRATFLPMSTIKGRELNEKGLEEYEGFIGIASSLCFCEQCYEGILSNLLGRIVVARDLDCAVNIAKGYSYRFRIVTLDGQVVNAGGSLTGGSLSKNAGLLGRASEIESIRRQAQEVSLGSENKMNEWHRLCGELEAAQQDAESLKNDIADVNEDKIKIEAEIKSRKTEQETVKQAFKEAEAERSAAVERLESLTEAMEGAEKEYRLYSDDIRRNEELVQVLSGSRNEFLRKREGMSEKLQQARITVLTLEKDIASAESEKENARLRCLDSENRIRSCNSEVEELEEKNKALQADIEEQKKLCKELSEKSEAAAAQIGNINARRMELEKRSSELRREEREKTAEREGINAELARLEERRVNLQKQYDDILGKLWEEYELTKREAEKAAVPIEEPSKAQRRLAELKQKIRALGSVNVSAIEEYKEVSRRYSFLKEQIGDVEKSKSELLKLINELTKQMREIFIDRFNEINSNFSSTFVELFGGGRASLSLSDPENVLTTGIDISVEPPGKIVSHIELLSGGEKALVAIALYFAIMKVSPSPFCVMDEIEAALDDVNVYRFAAYLRRMNDRTQFICITHRRGTMEEADVLYGVTMQDQGISKLLELRASELEQKLGI